MIKYVFIVISWVIEDDWVGGYQHQEYYDFHRQVFTDNLPDGQKVFFEDESFNPFKKR